MSTMPVCVIDLTIRTSPCNIMKVKFSKKYVNLLEMSDVCGLYYQLKYYVQIIFYIIYGY